MSTLKTENIQHPNALTPNISLTASAMSINSASVVNDLVVNGGTLRVDTANNRVGIGTLSPQGIFDVMSASSTYMRIDSSGRVMMPRQPRFQARLSTSASYNAGTDIIFNEVAFNVGSHYNPANGRFTAPISGYYIFYSMVRINVNGTYWYSYFKVNNTHTAALTGYGLAGLVATNSTGTGFNAGQGLVQVYLNASDYITSGPLWSGTIENQSDFGGYFLG